MELQEIFDMIRRNNHTRKMSIIYIADFLGIKYSDAEEIYKGEFECEIKQ